MTDLIAKGGRGHKAPYETTLVRVPLPIKPLVEKITAQWRKLFEHGSDEMVERLEAAIAPASPTLEEQLNRELVEAKNENRLLKEQCRIQEEKLAAIASSKVSPRTEIDYQQVRDRYLASLRLGKQAPEYKRAKQHIDAFIGELKKVEYEG